jgi:carbamoyl-phosphate synthase small subunit
VFSTPAGSVLALADGTVFMGQSVGAIGETSGELVFNTAMTGYQEILTDPSYSRQIVTLTYPHIGNYGTNTADSESQQIHTAGLVIRDLPLLASNFRQQQSLSVYLQQAGCVAIAGIDTRRLTQHLREHGAQNAALISLPQGQCVTSAVQAKALALAQATPSMTGQNLARVVSTSQPYEWHETSWTPQPYQSAGDLHKQSQTNPTRFHVVVFDLGVKHNILRLFADRACQITVIPADSSAEDALRLKPDGIFFSNGPGDPAASTHVIETARKLMEKGLPTFGICLGHQIMALACGAKTFKMKQGHHGANHPVKDLDTGRVVITSQNHGFAVDMQSLPDFLRMTHVSLFDGTLQGLARKDRPVLSFQGHPEASPGPHDVGYLFDRFMQLMNTAAGA